MRLFEREIRKEGRMSLLAEATEIIIPTTGPNIDERVKKFFGWVPRGCLSSNLNTNRTIEF